MSIDRNKNTLKPFQIQSRNFTSILLNFLYWKNEPLNVYKALSRFNIDSLYMRANDYETFNMNFVSRTMPNIRVLDIRSGRISALQSGFLKKLTKLSMGDNDIVIQKDFFGNGTLCFFPNLKHRLKDQTYYHSNPNLPILEYFGRYYAYRKTF
jgi:hypothetical protein